MLGLQQKLGLFNKTPMSRAYKQHMFSLKLSFKCLEANCQRVSCKVHIYAKIQNEQRKLKEVADMKKNVANFANNADIDWPNIALKYDDISGTYLDTLVTVSIHYETSEQGGLRTNKLKIGQVVVNLGKLLNTKTYRISTQYPVQKCYDPNAKLKMSIDLVQGEQTYGNIQANSFSSNRIKQEISQSNEGYSCNNRQALLVQSNWRVSQIKDRMNEDEKTLLQAKLQEYEDRIQKYRQQQNEQNRRATEQLDRKDEKISTLSLQSSSLTQALQSAQITIQRHKTRITSLEKELFACQQSVRSLTSKNSALTRELESSKQEQEMLNINIQQVEQSKEKKESYYKAQMDKYMQKYIESENSRNRLVFELETKMKEELAKKDEYFNQIVSKLESKLQTGTTTSKQIIIKREKELTVTQQKLDKTEKERNTLQRDLEQSSSQNKSLSQTVASLSAQLQTCISSMKTLQQESEVSSLSSNSLRNEIHRLKQEQRQQLKTAEEAKYELQIAHKTIEEQEAMIVKLNRNIKMHLEREYYMEERYQEDMETRTNNEEGLIGTTNYYRAKVNKLEIKIKFMDEKLEQAENSIHVVEKEKQKLQQEMKNSNRLLFEHSHTILRLQSESKRHADHVEELEFDLNSKNLISKQLESKLQQLAAHRQIEATNYVSTISEQDRIIKELNRKLEDNENEWEERFEVDQVEKNNVLAELEMEMQNMRNKEDNWRKTLTEKDSTLLQQQQQLQAQRDKARVSDKQLLKLKLELARITDEHELVLKQEARHKSQLAELRSESINLRSENTKLSKRLSKQKESYIELIKWILDRTWDSLSKEYVQQAGHEIDVELISFINMGLQRIYASHQKSRRQVEELREENENICSELERNRLEMQYQEEFGHETNKKGKLDISENLNETQNWAKFMESKNDHHIMQPIVNDFSHEYELSRAQQLRNLNYKLERDMMKKMSEMESLNEQLFEEKSKNRQLTDQIKSLKIQIEDLNLAFSKKTSLINTLQTQLSDRDLQVSSYTNFNQSYTNKSPTRQQDFKTQAENKYKEQKIISELEKKLDELDRQNTLQKSKIDLLESKMKINADKMSSDAQRITSLEKNLKQKEEMSRRLTKDNEDKDSYNEKLKKELELSISKFTKKQTSIQELRNQIQQLRRINQILSKELEEWETKYNQKQKQAQKQLSQIHRTLLETTQNLAMERMEKQKISLQQTSQIATLKSSLKQAQRRVGSLESLLNKTKTESQQLHERHLKLMNEKSESEEQIKDIKMNESLAREKLDKMIADLHDKLQAKDFELEELRFSSQSKIMELEKQIEEAAIIQI